MQDRYAGDVGDFGKYGLLRRLSGSDPRLSLGVVWYRTDEEVVQRDPPNDGRHISYLNPNRSQRFKPCDPDLYCELANLVEKGNRTIGAVESSRILPSDTVYCSDPLQAPRGESVGQRLHRRAQWLAATANVVLNRDIVFVDPDNGLESPSVHVGSTKAPKYVFLSDLDAIMGPNQTLIAYHHLARVPRLAEVQRRTTQLSMHLHRRAFALHFRRGTSRAFLIAPAREHEEVIGTRVREMLAGPWAEHFERIDVPASV